MTVVVAAACIFFIANRWNYNSIDAGDETARVLASTSRWSGISEWSLRRWYPR